MLIIKSLLADGIVLIIIIGLMFLYFICVAVVGHMLIKLYFVEKEACIKRLSEDPFLVAVYNDEERVN